MTPPPPGGKPPSKGGGSTKPFLADDDLLSELDQWDATFDALHEESTGLEMPREQVMEWPPPSTFSDEPAVLESGLADPAPLPSEDAIVTAHANLGVDLDDQPTLDADLAGLDDDATRHPRGSERASTRATRPPDLIDEDYSPHETDFTIVGAIGEPSALGEMLGRARTLPVSDDDDVADPEPNTRIDMRSVKSRAATRPPDGEDLDDDDEVFTSASRPAPPSPVHADDDAVAPPPAPVEARRTAAIVRRGVASNVSSRGDKPTPARGVDISAFGEFAEQTRIQEPEELEARRNASKTAPPPAMVEDEYEIEIGADAESRKPDVAVEIEPVARRTAHVVRREVQATRPPPAVLPPTSDDLDEQTIEFEADPPPSRPGSQDAPIGEADFSDVAFDAVVEERPSRQDATSRPTGRPETARAADLDGPDGLDRLDAAKPVPQADERELYGTSDQASLAAPPTAPIELYPRVKTPTSVPPMAAARPGLPRLQSMIPVELEAPDPEPAIDLAAAVKSWPEQVAPIASSTLDAAAAEALDVYERELATLDESDTSAYLRIEAGRLSEQLGEADRARGHYDAALLADPRATAALRGLRRLARASGDLQEAVRHLDAEIAVAGALERRPLGHYRIDLLMASNDQDLARVAVGEVLDSARSDVRALLAYLELAFLDGRADEFGSALERLAHAVTDPELRAAVQSARGILAAQHNDSVGAAAYFAAAAESDPMSLAARIGAVRQAAAQADAEGAAHALLDLARQVEPVDRITAAAAAIRAQQWVGGATAAAAAALAIASAPTDPLVARLAAETSASSENGAVAAAAFAHWAHVGTSSAERAYAAARAAELDPSRGTELWSAALSADPGDDYAAAQLRTAHVAADATELAIAVDLGVAADVERERARLRAAYGLIAQGQLERAIEILEQGRTARPGSLALAEALGEALAAADRWTDRATLYADLAAEPGGQLDKEIAQLRSALAWEEAVGAAAAVTGETVSDELQRATASALAAWEVVLEGASAPEAHAATIVLASRLGDRDVLGEVLLRAQTAERWPWAAASFALRRARLFADDPGRAAQILRDARTGLDDPRRTVALVLGAARAKDLGDAASALEERATILQADSTLHAGTEIGTLRLRAAQLALDANDAPRATVLLAQVEQVLPQLGIVSDLLAAARRRAGDRPISQPVRRIDLPTSGPAAADAFARIVRDADLAAALGDGPGSLAMYLYALELRPGDPLAAVPLIRTATQLGDPQPIAGLAIAQLHAAEEAQDGVAKAVAYELLAHIDGDLRSDQESAQVALESAAQADPSRVDLLHRLERRYTAADQLGELIRLRRSEVELVPIEHAKDRAALLADLASLATRDQRPEIEIAELHRRVLAVDPRRRAALMHLEAIVRRAGVSVELAELEEAIADYFEGDPKTQTAFWTRAGETLAELGKIDEAVLVFGKADAALPGHVPALEAWRQAALKGQLWIDVAEAANRQAAGATDDKQKAKLYHFAGVALMDKALDGEHAMTAFKQALEAEPSDRDSFLRLRILLEEDADHDELAALLERRLVVEEVPALRMDLHRALAELCRNFLSDREHAKEHYRFILAGDPNDLRAHAAIADIAWEQGNWQEAADALMARARLERSPDVLKTLCFRLGLIYADRLVDLPMALKAFQRALTYQPNDENTLVRLADLATEVKEWKLALGACERLVKNELDQDRRAQHLHRVARIFRDGFNDTKRAERALNLALDGAPTNDEALAQLVDFYKASNDMVSARVHLNRVVGQMRMRVEKDPQDGLAYRVISRAMSARAAAGVDGSLAIARSAAELAELLNEAGEPEQKLLRAPPTQNYAPLLRPEADDLVFPSGIPVELRQIFHLLADKIGKHVPFALGAYGVTRGERLRANTNATASVAQSVATGLGFGELDVYVSTRQPFAMVADNQTSPAQFVIGAAIAQMGGDAIRFAAGGALKLVQSSMALPARLPPEELGVLVISLMRLLQPEFPIVGVDADQVATQNQKLKRLIPNNLLTELKPYAANIDGARFDYRQLARELQVASACAGLMASGSLSVGLRVLAGAAEGELPGFLADPVAQGLISFALNEDHAAMSR